MPFPNPTTMTPAQRIEAINEVRYRTAQGEHLDDDELRQVVRLLHAERGAVPGAKSAVSPISLDEF